VHICSIRRHERSLPAMPGRDFHGQVWRIHRNDQAGMTITMAEGTLAVPAQRVVVVPPGAMRLHTLHPLRHFNADLFVVDAPGLPAAPVLLPDDDTIREALRALRRGPFPSQSLDPMTVTAAVLMIARALLLKLPAGSDPTTADPPAIAAAVAAMRERPQHAWANHHLAELCGLSTGGFITIFRRLQGRTPQRWLMDLRLAQAAELLNGSNLDLETIAGHLGFAHRSHLSRRFRAQYGMSPQAWRRNG